MGLLSWFVIGLLVGLGALLTARDRRTDAVAVVLCGGVIGSLAGGLLYSLFRWGSLAEFRVGSAILALLGAALSVAAVRVARALQA